MRVRSLLPCLFFAYAMSASAMSKVEADTLVTHAQQAYAKGDHAEALRLFDSVAVQFNSAALQLNLGNCWFKLGDVPNAILHYERGARLAPGDEDIQANLDLAREQVKDRISAPPAFALGTTWASIRGGREPDQWAKRSLWASVVFFALLALAYLLRGRSLRKAVSVLAGMAFVVLALSVTFAAVRHAEVVDDSEAIIMAPKVDVRGEPRTGSTVLFVLHKGTKVSVLQEAEGWYEVRLPNGSVGWMPFAALVRI